MFPKLTIAVWSYGIKSVCVLYRTPPMHTNTAQRDYIRSVLCKHSVNVSNLVSGLGKLLPNYHVKLCFYWNENHTTYSRNLLDFIFNNENSERTFIFKFYEFKNRDY